LMKLVTKSVVEDKLTFLLDQETLKKGKDGDIGYHTMYCKHSELHPDEDAQRSLRNRLFKEMKTILTG
ncbi:MAG: hypothetical protein AAFR39_09345, partial [Pseudomonadota bacterium]